jgi:hypothetical protein
MAGLAAVRQERQNLTPKKLCVSLGSLLGSGFHPPSGNSVEEIEREKEGQELSKGLISEESGIHTIGYLLPRPGWGENARMNCIHKLYRVIE